MMTFILSEAEKASYDAWQDAEEQRMYDEQKQEWIEEHGEDTLDEFEKDFSMFMQMMYKEDFMDNLVADEDRLDA
jgi:hypothetical protein